MILNYSIAGLIKRLDKETGDSNRFILLKNWAEAIIERCQEKMDITSDPQILEVIANSIKNEIQ